MQRGRERTLDDAMDVTTAAHVVTTRESPGGIATGCKRRVP